MCCVHNINLTTQRHIVMFLCLLRTSSPVLPWLLNLGVVLPMWRVCSFDWFGGIKEYLEVSRMLCVLSPGAPMCINPGGTCGQRLLTVSTPVRNPTWRRLANSPRRRSHGACFGVRAFVFEEQSSCHYCFYVFFSATLRVRRYLLTDIALFMVVPSPIEQ